MTSEEAFKKLEETKFEQRVRKHERLIRHMNPTILWRNYGYYHRLSRINEEMAFIAKAPWIKRKFTIATYSYRMKEIKYLTLAIMRDKIKYPVVTYLTYVPP